MAGRGRPKKIRLEEFIENVEPIIESIVEKDIPINDSIIEELWENKKIKWDFKKGDDIPFFDSDLSYEVSGYRPINGTQGLDFNPEWFTLARRTKQATGHYCEYPRKTKAYNDFWRGEYIRCVRGYTVNGYTITGDNYYFLNYYRLFNIEAVDVAGEGRTMGYATFFVKQYEYFHYIELCKILKLNAVGLKARGVGFSEIGASIAVNTYNAKRRTRTVVAASSDDYKNGFLSKCWEQLSYLNAETDGGFKKLKQVKNSADHKRASIIRGKEETGWLSEIVGITADKPRKIRGDRVDVLFYEESGSWPNWKKAFLQGDALVGVTGRRFGIKLGWGTGGDSGPALEGLAAAFYSPKDYDILPFRSKYNKKEEEALTAFFIPAYTIVNLDGYIDHRGWTDPEKGKEHYMKERSGKGGDPEGFMIYCAEFCFNPEEALALEGDNQFNSALLSEQLANIMIHKRQADCGTVECGYLDYKFNGEREDANISGYLWTPNPHGRIQILEHPIREPETNQPYRNLYVAGIDSIDLGQEDTSSKTTDPSDFCLVIKKRVFGMNAPRIVCIYKDRPQKVRDAYITALKLLRYYNCKAVLESTKTSLLTWFREKGVANRFLMKRPRSALSDIQSGTSNLFGVQATIPMITHQLDLIANHIEDYCGEIWFTDMLEEALKYSIQNKRKYDIIAAWGMCELGDEELSGITAKPTEDIHNTFRDIGYWKDERGIKRFGVIPKPQEKAKFNLEQNDTNRIRSSDPRNFN